ncbi:isoamylase 2, chloroplastic [Aegilops tauschii subsp. strangulata]|uniref:Glycosyl hydrolase family 13 catalytic domain-containing protein n=2 Tax=Triticinae TaxID=1648030 RepID=A0A3B5ZXA8_WHEAT|nr:isoamylase 2, chloroplastic [Triticum aestivum]
MASLLAPPASTRGILPPPRRPALTPRAARSCYRFRTDDDGVVDVAVAAGEGGGYTVGVEVPPLPGARRREGGLLLRPAGSAEAVPLDGACPAAELSFRAPPAPFSFSFLLTDGEGAEIRTHRRTPFRVPVGVGPGSPAPLGLSLSEGGAANFALYSRSAKGVVLCLYGRGGGGGKPALEIELDPYVNRTGNVWHVSLESVEGYGSYGFRCGLFGMGHPLLDPYAKVIGDLVAANPLHVKGITAPSMSCLGSLATPPSYNWGRDKWPRLPLEKLVVYRANVALFTKDKSSGLPDNVAGTFSGVASKIQRFRSLGVNAVLLEPVFQFDQVKGPYFPYHFFSPMDSYGGEGCSASAITAMKDMVKAMHRNGIEVLLEVVFTHTAEGEADGQMISISGVDNSSYYIADEIAGCKSGILNCNSPVTQNLILDSLRHWVIDFHVDGFCFINAPFLVRGPRGEYLSRPPLLESIAFDPVLSKTKIIADPWSPLGISNVQFPFPHWKRWAEMNTRFSIDVRNFLKGEALIGALATRLCGSGDLFSNRGPAFSFNYVSRNSGLTLVDLVSFSNGDLASESSWNCGEEGPSEDSVVLQKRLRQIRNFIFILFVSLGIPVLNMGDECGHSSAGSTSYKDRVPLNWKALKTSFVKEVTGFISFLAALRSRRGDIFQRREFLKLENISWHGNNLSEPRWEDPTSKFLCMHIIAENDVNTPELTKGDLYICFNSNEEPASATLPAPAEGSVWLRLVDTSLALPGFFTTESNLKVHQVLGYSSYEVKAHSCVLFESKRDLPQFL